MLKRMPEAIQVALMHAITGGVRGVFLWATAFAAVAFVVALFIREVPLRGGPIGAPAASPAASEDAATEVVAEPVSA
jgi:hypothetical protein